MGSFRDSFISIATVQSGTRRADCFEHQGVLFCGISCLEARLFVWVKRLRFMHVNGADMLVDRRHELLEMTYLVMTCNLGLQGNVFEEE